jgi:hypothetical protein
VTSTGHFCYSRFRTPCEAAKRENSEQPDRVRMSRNQTATFQSRA